MKNIEDKDIEKLTRRTINIVLIKIGEDSRVSTETAIDAFLDGHLVLVDPGLIWHNEDGTIYLPVAASATKIKQRIKDKGYNVENRTFRD